MSDGARRAVAMVVATAAGIAFLASISASLVDLWRAPPSGISSADAGMMGGLAGLALIFLVGMRLVVAGFAACCAAAALAAFARGGRISGWTAPSALALVLLALLARSIAVAMHADDLRIALDWVVLPMGIGMLLATFPWRAAGAALSAMLGRLPRPAEVRPGRPAGVEAAAESIAVSDWAARAKARLPLLLLAFVAYAGVALLLLIASPVAAPWADPDLPFGTLLRVASQPWLNLALRAGAAHGTATLVCASGFALNLAILTWLFSAWLSSARR